uniref:Uncharacterized protein n=3 Tax=Aegilops tauschii subsp. strangulata TaxID=200361 RepID=A0A453GDH2_AEGTS
SHPNPAPLQSPAVERVAAMLGDPGGLSNLLEDKDGRFRNASPDLSHDALVVGGLDELGSSVVNPPRPSWGELKRADDGNRPMWPCKQL